MCASATDTTLLSRELFQPSIHLRAVAKHARTTGMNLKTKFNSTSDISLSDALRLNMRKSAFDKTPNSFLPQGALDSLVTSKSVLTAMGIIWPTEADTELARYVISKAKRAFATAVYVDLQPQTLHRAMLLFRNAGFGDENLPLEEISGERYITNTMIGLDHPLSRTENVVQNETERIWTFRRVHAFVEAQFKFLAPVIYIGKSDYDLGNRILPFVKKHEAQAEGSFGVVSKYEVHSAHIQNVANQTIIPANVCAVKRIKSYDASDRHQVAQRWASEVKALAAMNTLNQEHIVQFITAFRRGSSESLEHYVVFEWADGGNLRDLWKSIPHPPLTAPFVKSVIRQLRGLSDALSAAHYPNNYVGCTEASFRHGDLKPENILRFGGNDTGIGTLKIADWGEAKSHQLATVLRQSNTTSRFGTRRYEPPECETGVGSRSFGQENMRISRLFDIWSFGCIALEMIIWLLHGDRGLHKFYKSLKTDLGDDPPFYQIIRTGQTRSAQVHQMVVSWMNYMSKDPACHSGTTALGDLLELVQHGLLVVTLPSRFSMLSRSRFQAGNEAEILRLGLTPIEDRERIPKIAITAAEDIETRSSETPPEPTIMIPQRLRADELRNKLQLIELNDSGDSYWSTKRVLPIPNMTSESTSISISQNDSGEQSQLCRHYDCSELSQTSEQVDSDHLQPDQVLRKDVDSEAHFSSRGRTKGSPNKRTAQSTAGEAVISTSESSNSGRTKVKRARVERKGGQDEGEQDNQKQLLQRDELDTSANLGLACPFAKKIPLEYPQCRKSQYRDIAKVKEHLRKHHRTSCPRCGEAFHNGRALDEHLRQTEICTRASETTLEKTFTYMKDEQEAAISKYGISWFDMFRCLFPDHPVPDSCRHEDSERLVFSLIESAHGSPSSALQVFDAYQRNILAESTCSARAALHHGLTLPTFQAGPLQTSDSGYGAPEEEDAAAVGTSVRNTGEQQDSVPDAAILTGIIAATNPMTEAEHNSNLYQQHLQEETINSAVSTANIDVPSLNGNMNLPNNTKASAGNSSNDSSYPAMEDANATESPLMDANQDSPTFSTLLQEAMHEADWNLPHFHYSLDSLGDGADLFSMDDEG